MDNNPRHLHVATDADEAAAQLAAAHRHIEQLEAALRAIRHLSHAADWADHNAA